ncbi:MAG: Flp family type IVb pilin [Candidatus Nealsonbacteria bacterium]|nr:Flp family type IVb pilin [Candidatus Nealsonbacteria bacterium]
MKSFLAKITRFLAAEDGPTVVEYAAMLMLIFLACISVITVVGQSTATNLERSQNAIDDAMQ